MAAMSDKNVGTADRLLRFVLGFLMMGFTFTTPNQGEWLADLVDLILTVFGFSLVLSAILAHCWVYQALGISTCATD